MGNILNNHLFDKNKSIELSKKYQVFSKYTSLYAEIENEHPNTSISNLKLMKKIIKKI